MALGPSWKERLGSLPEAGRDAVRKLLAENPFPESERPRMLENAEFYGIA